MTNVSTETRAASSDEAAARAHDLAVIIEHGVVAGMIGAAVVAIWFLLFDVLLREAFYTPSLIGSVIFQDLDVHLVTGVNTSMVFAYSGLHGAAFLIAGTVLAWMFSLVERNPQFGLVLVLLFLLFQSVIFGFEAAIVPNLVGALGAWAVAMANLLSAVAMFWFLLRRRPRAMARLRESWEE
ncbi:MAG: hypothetical protein Q8R92_01725 [Deltaproteobacteria bacterium]|nr:hypothetical protein [Deltaproteobacteria bacterium]